jgi:drug/metabolite transporter (DMT)-like permease
MPTVSRDTAIGAVWALLAIVIWSGSLVYLKLGVVTGLTGADLAALRFGTAALILAPFLFRVQRPLPSLRSMLVVVVTFGAPYVFLLSQAMQTVPAAAAGALNPGAMAIIAVLLALYDKRTLPPRSAIIGIALTGIGLIGFALAGGGWAPGHLILLVTGLMWALYARTVRRNAIDAPLATTIVAVGSAVGYLPVYLALPHDHLTSVAASALLTQVVVQGFLVSIVAVYAFTRSLELLGPLVGPSLPALIPVTTLILDRVILGAPVSSVMAICASLITFGLAGLLAPRKQRR